MMQWTPATFGVMVVLLVLTIVVSRYMGDSEEVEDR